MNARNVLTNRGDAAYRGFGGQFIRGYTFDHTESRPCDPRNAVDLVDGADCAMAKALNRCDLTPDGRGVGHGAGGVKDFLGEYGHGTMGYPKFDGPALDSTEQPWHPNMGFEPNRAVTSLGLPARASSAPGTKGRRGAQPGCRCDQLEVTAPAELAEVFRPRRG